MNEAWQIKYSIVVWDKIFSFVYFYVAFIVKVQLYIIAIMDAVMIHMYVELLL